MIKRKETYLFLAIILLAIISIINLYNAKYLNSFYTNYYIKQFIWFVIGFTILILLKKINVVNIFKYSKYIYFFNIMLLALVLFTDRINGTRAWIKIFNISIQPSEFMKLSLALFLINESQKKEKKFINVCKLILYTIIPSILVFVEPDTGAIVFYGIILLSILFTKKIKWYFYLLITILIIIFISLFFYCYYNNQDVLISIFGTSFFYRVERIINFKVNNYQLNLALISIFSTPFIRNGFGNILLYIPEGTTDFIFAFCVGNFGKLLVLIILLCYIIIIFYFIKLLNIIKNKKTNYLTICFLYMFIFQILINILMNIGLIPTIGITLPFLSYGGSSLLLYFLFIAIILRLSK